MIPKNNFIMSIDLKVFTRFAVASDAGIGALMYLTETISREKFSEIIPEESLERYISKQFDKKKLIDDLNDMLSQQWLVVYVNEYPVGYAKITSKGKKPEIGNKTAVRIAEFGILKKYDDPVIWLSLFTKCLSVTSFYDVIWINEYIGDPVVTYFEKMNFTKANGAGNVFELPLPSVYLIRKK